MRANVTTLLLRVAAAALLGLASALAAGARAADADGLRTQYRELREQLHQNGFGRPLHIDSAEQQNRLTGVVHAVLEHRFEVVSAALRSSAGWCDILILPFNTKYCHALEGPAGSALLVRIGRRYDQPVEQAYRLRFDYRNLAARPDYFESRLHAAEGPVGTRDYRIAVAAVPLDGGRTFLRLDYSYAVGAAGRMAMQLYLATAGAGKVGFTETGRDEQGRPHYIGGVRGAVERNAMRYYLAIDAHLDSLSAAPGQQRERRIQSWYTAVERWPQLRELDRETYAAMKRQEYERQQALLQ
ncbi:hypothetical protein PE066_08455 [Ramlibacter tataouinensis]|uniref:hypothetical protein n=1 Tax=Ramlibacter tataouinensis TaxID=94132 RepID=UPI0022F39D9E|nr:hypothetical protein [Ramlibacter tataouinensis]WBY03549.1 hypothetical protein PE066_08455 [Ramlibacter tataouinensis]